ncbi:hypothetical protein CVT25_015821 [Psilocybe cyanescens]|uniref:N-acetyltransferase domain-containing protein n=1 Tax=Psilocybe cyanescens TaxID=93625 RepID=A0A409XIH3_PSICY|nr:hypothetical protein CVT25_015821 [Psilocybe cyanescens]
MIAADGEILYPHVKRLIEPTAWTGDPFTEIIMGGNVDLSPLQIRANLQAALIGGEVHVITIGQRPEDIVGVAIWFPPGSSAFSRRAFYLRIEEQRAAGWNQFLESIPESLRKWWIEYFSPAMTRLSADTLGPGYSHDAWHLHIFGVMKSHHRKGYGKALLRLAEDQAKETHSPIVLETTTDVDVQIYKRLGFKVCGETNIESAQGIARIRLMFKEN